MMIALEFHGWRGLSLRRDPIDFELWLGFVSLIVSRDLLSDVLRSLKAQLAAARKRLGTA